MADASPPPGLIPRRLWMFWNKERMPEFVAACVAALRRTNPGWNVTVLNPRTASALGLQYTPDALVPITDQQRSDWMRLEVLARYGGVYMDASNVNFRSVEHWLNRSSSAVQGFNRPARGVDNTIVSEGYGAEMESWAIAAPSGSRFAGLWRDNFAAALRNGTEAWVGRQPAEVVGSLNAYLAIEVAWKRTRFELDAHEYPTVVRSSTDFGRPFHFMLPADWVSFWVTYDAMRAPYPVAGTDFFKFRGTERDCVAPLWFYSAFNCWPLAPCAPENVAGFLRAQLEQEPDLLASSYTELRWAHVGHFLLQWAWPLTFLLLLTILLVWVSCYFVSARCRSCTDRCGHGARLRAERVRDATCPGCFRRTGEAERLTSKSRKLDAALMDGSKPL